MKSRNIGTRARAIAMHHHWFFWLRSGEAKRANVMEIVLNYAAIFALHGLILRVVGLRDSSGASCLR